VIDVSQDSGGFPKYLRDIRDASVSIMTTDGFKLPNVQCSG
jgi:hypothetical protein